MIENILSRLEKVRRTGRDSWLACCPAHDDRNPSMTIRALDDGRILCRCFALCPFDSIVAAVGLDWDEWFPPKPIEYAKPLSRPFPAADVLAALATETGIVEMAATMMALSQDLSTEDTARLLIASDRIRAARELAIG